MGACVPGRNTRLCLNWRGSRAYRPCAGPGLWWSGSRNSASGGTRGILPRCTPRADPAARSRQLAPHLSEAGKHWEFPRGLRVCDLTGETLRRGVTFHSPDCWRSARARNSNACCNRANPSPHRISACSAETLAGEAAWVLADELVSEDSALFTAVRKLRSGKYCLAGAISSTA